METVSEAPLLTVEKVVLHNMSPVEASLNKPASVRAPVATPAENVATAVRVFVEAVYDVSDARPTSAPRAVSPAAGDVLSVPSPIWLITFDEVPTIREAI